ncbi:polysaccharide deacetylase [Lachnospiraceae bacterium ZAX-1]
MEEKNTEMLKEQKMRRKRVNRLKTSIVLFIGIWIVLSITLYIGMIRKIVTLEEKIDMIAKGSNEVSQVSSEENSLITAADPKTMQAQNVKEADGQGKEDPSELANGVMNVVDGVRMGQEDDNLVKVGERQKVYLTFDDGPSENTARILDILKEKGVKATFFVIGQEDEESKVLYQRIVAEGHTLGMHSYTHKYSVIYDSLEAFAEDLTQLQGYLNEITGVEPNIMRFPGGSSNQVSNTDMTEFIAYLNEQDITYYDWNVASGDATSQAYTPDELIENVMRDVAKYSTSIVLMHDSSTKATTVDALGPMIDKLKEAKVELLPIDHNTKRIQHIPAESVN